MLTLQHDDPVVISLTADDYGRSVSDEFCDIKRSIFTADRGGAPVAGPGKITVAATTGNGIAVGMIHNLHHG